MYACFTLSNVPTLSYVLTHADQVHLELLEVLELYCETLHARFALLELKKYVAFDFFFHAHSLTLSSSSVLNPMMLYVSLC